MSVRFGPFEVDADRRQLLKSGSEVHLTPKAFDLLALLIDDAPRVIRKDKLHRKLWTNTFVSDATLVGLIKEIRRALDDRDAKRPIIRTAHGVGYSFAAELQRAITSPSANRWIVAGSRRIALSEGEHVIGREPTATVRLESTGISRRHARIVVTSTGALIEDLGSKNGTMVNEKVLSAAVSLHDGDRISLGSIVVIYHASASGVSTETIVRKSI